MVLRATPTCHTEPGFQKYSPHHPTESSPGCHGTDRKTSTHANAGHELAAFVSPGKARYLTQLPWSPQRAACFGRKVTACAMGVSMTSRPHLELLLEQICCAAGRRRQAWLACTSNQSPWDNLVGHVQGEAMK